MIVYHGSDRIVDHPDVNHSYRDLDFGRGFYVTTVKEQAEKWARRKAGFSKDHAKAILNIYEMKEDLSRFAFKDFGDDLDTWIDFVCQCRDGDQGYRAFDLIKGKVANDKVFRVVDMYHNGIWDKERALKEIRVYPTYDQIAFITQTAIDGLLTFQSSQEVSL
jgi:hypothetical protein